MVKRLSSMFKKPNDKHVTLKSEPADDSTPPPSPDGGGSEPLNVTVVASPYASVFQEEQSYGGTTISDLSASVVRNYARRQQPHTSPIREEEESQQTKTTRGTALFSGTEAASTILPEDSGSGGGCSPESMVTSLFGIMDESCGSRQNIAGFGSVKTSNESYSRVSRHTWGTAPSRDDDEDDEDYTVREDYTARLSTIGTTVVSDEKRDTNAVSTHTSSNTRHADPPAQSSPDRSERSHENFELILDPSVLRGEVTPKRKPLKWMKPRSSVPVVAEEKKEMEEVDRKNKQVTLRSSVPAVTPTREPQAGKATVKKPPLIQRLSQRAGAKKAGVAKSARELTEEDLLGEEFVEENEAPESVRSLSEIDQILDEAEKDRISETSESNEPRSRSWGNLTRSLSKRRTGSSDQKASAERISRANSPALSLGAESKKEPQSSANSQPKNLWKTAQDPSGRTYYYHRLTRKTTWSKPENYDTTSKVEEEQGLRKSVRPETPKASEFKDAAKTYVPADIVISKDPDLSAEAQRKIDAGEAQSEIVGQVSSILKKASSQDYSDKDTRAKKEEITRLLTKMAPPDGNSVVNLMKQYEGREEELLVQLRDLVKKQPFDEPLKSAPSFADIDQTERNLVERSASASSLQGRTRTSNTTNTGFTEKTERINNTGRSSADIFESIKEGEDSFEDESLSSNNESEPNFPTSQRYRAARIEKAKKKLASGRTRDLRVEEFSSSRLKAETFNEKATAPPTPRQRKVNTLQHSLEPVTHGPPGLKPPGSHLMKDIENKNEATHNLDMEDTDLDTFADTVSALSQSDAEFHNRRHKFDRARKRALDDAIRRRDWDLAASVTDNMRNRSLDSSRDDGVLDDLDYREWTQSELDQFISENHWDAVAKYIAQMRDDNNEDKLRARRPRNGDILNPDDAQSERYDDSIQKRFGARSQLQHYHDDHSISSWESESFYESDYTSTSSLSYGYDAGKLKLTSRREFAC